MLFLFIGKIHLQFVVMSRYVSLRHVTSRYVTSHLVTTSYIFLNPRYTIRPAMNARLSV